MYPFIDSFTGIEINKNPLTINLIATKTANSGQLANSMREKVSILVSFSSLLLFSYRVIIESFEDGFLMAINYIIGNGSSLSLVSTASSLYSSQEEKQAPGIHKFRIDLAEAHEKVNTLFGQLSTNVSLCKLQLVVHYFIGCIVFGSRHCCLWTVFS